MGAAGVRSTGRGKVVPFVAGVAVLDQRATEH